jgi:hypothetical protein
MMSPVVPLTEAQIARAALLADYEARPAAQNTLAIACLLFG